MRSEPDYDVIVVVSGAGGDIASSVLAMNGLRVLCLKAVRMISPSWDFHTHVFPYQWPYSGLGRLGEYGKLPQGMNWKIMELTDH